MLSKRRSIVATGLMVHLCALSGCGPSLIQPTGKVVSNEKIYKPVGIQVGFVPIGDAEGKRTYPAEFQSDGTFNVPGIKRKGIPPGKYRVDVRIIPPMSEEDNDRLKGVFAGAKSPFVFDLTDDKEEIVLDISKAAK